jgi:hypothetical protein
MNTYMHLLWKEYRAVRLFWIAVVVLVAFLQWIVASTAAGDIRWQLILHLAFAAPALFAAGAAGTAFASEKEEGTFEFLRASPITDRQVFTSKVGLAVLATLCMCLVLWPITAPRVSSDLIQSFQFQNMAGLWLVGAVEAIAWGTLFSLITARPLVAVILAFVFGTSIIHFIVGIAVDKHTPILAAYAQVAPIRLAIAGFVLLLDIAIGRQWLENGPFPLHRRRVSLAPRAALEKPRQLDTEISNRWVLNRSVGRCSDAYCGSMVGNRFG